MTRLTRSFAGLLLLASAQPLTAHPGHSHPSPRQREPEVLSIRKDLKDPVGPIRPVPRQGSFVAVHGDTVQIRRPDDSLVEMSLRSLNEQDQSWVSDNLSRVRTLNLQIDARPAEEVGLLLAQADQNRNGRGANQPPAMTQAFEAFVKASAIRTRWDNQYFYVESNGIPDHQMMVGITSWQQQVPLPQKYFGDNSWRIPLHPVPAAKPQSARNDFLRGAIALAVNGIPIFNPLNNRGDDAFLFGELDEFGGHCGRADDYHYHLAPVHLEKTVGKGLPIAYALDGYAIYGYEEPDGSPVQGLDAFNGHTDKNGNYHYHASKTYPYLNGGFHGEVVKRDGQVDPQPRAEPVRPSLPPMQGAKIIGFEQSKPGHFTLTYDIRGRQGTARCELTNDGAAVMTLTDTSGRKTTETYTPRRGGGPPGGNRGGAGGDRPPRDPPPRPRDNRPPPPRGQRPPRESETTASTATSSNLPQLKVTSAAVDAQGRLLKEFTCDGSGASPPVEWSGAPEGAKALALNLWHIPGPGKIKSYRLVYNIPVVRAVQ